MTDRPQRPGLPSDASDPHPEPAINQTERDRSAMLGPKDTDTGPEGQHPDPDDYAGAEDH